MDITTYLGGTLLSKDYTNIPLTTAQAESILSRWLGDEVKCTGIERLYGGMINSVLKLYFDREPFDAVIKLRPTGDSGFAAEARKLEYLQANTSFPCPRVYYEDSSAECAPLAFLILETIPGVSLGYARLSLADRANIDRELAEVLLELHSHTRDMFGGLYEQPGKQKWTDVFVPRLLNMRKKAKDKLPEKVLRDIDCAVGVAEEVMSGQGQPTLVHGDIWAGNVMVAQNEDGGWHLSGIVDPGTQYADVEMELAYLEVFNTVGPDFFQSYTSRRPLRRGYELRRLFYLLNTYMIHVWLFGDAHYRQMTAKVAATIELQVS